MTARFNSVDEYIRAQPDSIHAMLQLVRTTIRKAVPGAEEEISYNMPTYRLHGGVVLHLAGWKRHYSLYPCTALLITAFKDELAPYEVNHKGTVRFPLSEPVPVKLIAGMAKFRAREIAEKEKTASGPLKKSKHSG